MTIWILFNTNFSVEHLAYFDLDSAKIHYLKEGKKDSFKCEDFIFSSSTSNLEFDAKYMWME